MKENIGKNIGENIKMVARIASCVGVLGYFIWGILLVSAEQMLLGWIVIIVGSLISWISYYPLYGFGELVVRIVSIDEKLKKVESENQASES